MKKQIKRLVKFISILSFTTLVPFLAYAQTAGSTCGSGLVGILCRISDFFDAVLPVLVALGVIYFVWGVVQYVIGDSEEAKKKGRDRIIFGIIGLAVIVSIWGLVAILNQTLGLGGATGLVGENAPNVSNLVPSTSTTSTDCNLSTNPKLQNLLVYATCIIKSSVIPLIFALAVVMFVWGAIKFFIIDASKEEKKSQGKQFMIWGIIALAVMVSVWGLVKIVGETFSIDTGFLPQVRP